MTDLIEDRQLEALPCLAGSVIGAGLKTVQLTPWGEVASKKGTFVVDGEAARAVVAAFDQHDCDLPVDFEHQTLAGVYSSPSGKAPAAGWIKKLWGDRGRGLMALIQWNDGARDMIRAGEYAYLSPVMVIRKSDRRVVEIHSAGLTNKPALAGLQRLAASERPFGTETLTMAEDEQAKPEGDGGDGESAVDLLRKIAGVLNIKAKSTEEVLQAVLEYLEDDQTSPSAPDEQVASSVRKRLGLADDAGADEVIVAMSTLAGTGPATVVSGKAERNAQAMVDMYLKSGRINPNDGPAIQAAMSLAREQPERLRALMDNAASVIPPQGLTKGPPVPSLRGKAIAYAIASYRDDGALQRQTTMEAFTNLALHDEGLPKLGDGELATFV